MRTLFSRPGLVVVAAVAAAALLPASAPAAKGHKKPPKCGAASKAKHTKVVDRSKLAVVFTRKGNYYGCVYGSRKVRKYSQLCCQDVQVDVSGRYLGYTYTGTAIGDEANKLGAINLRSGAQLKIAKLAPNSEGGGLEIDTSHFVPDFLITSKGMLVWLQTGAGENEYELRAGDGSPRTERIIDTGTIDPMSLKASADQASVTYTKDGVATTAALLP